MPIVNHRIEIGTLIRYIGPSRDDSDVQDTIEGAVYRIAGIEGGDIYYLDCIGEKNFAASPDGDGDFEIVEPI